MIRSMGTGDGIASSAHIATSGPRREVNPNSLQAVCVHFAQAYDNAAFTRYNRSASQRSTRLAFMRCPTGTCASLATAACLSRTITHQEVGSKPLPAEPALPVDGTVSDFPNSCRKRHRGDISTGKTTSHLGTYNDLPCNVEVITR